MRKRVKAMIDARITQQDSQQDSQQDCQYQILSPPAGERSLRPIGERRLAIPFQPLPSGSPISLKIYALIKRRPKLTSKKISEALGLPTRKAVNASLYSLLHEGFVYRNPTTRKYVVGAKGAPPPDLRSRPLFDRKKLALRRKP
jgi:hypothetical protein